MSCRLAVAAIFLWSSAALFAAEIHGKVSSADGGEALARIHVAIPERKAEAVTAADGTFQLKGLPSGDYTLRLSAVGYRLMNVAVSVSAPDSVLDLSLVMVPDNYRRTEAVEVRADVFQAEDSPAVLEENLTSSEIRQASTVLADDPFRAVQALPGISASGNNELLAQFSVMGAPYSDVGIYLDDVLIPSPLHEDANDANAASLSLLTGELVEEMKILPVAYPEHFGDRVGAALDIHTRDGSRSRPLFRVSVGLGYSDGVGEGRIGPGKRGSWLVSLRKSYVGYLVHNLIRSDFADVSFYDGEGKVVYDLTPKQTVSAYALGGHTYINDSTVTGQNDVRQSTGDLFIYRAGWRWTATPRFVLDAHGAYVREPIVELNPSGQVLNRATYYEWSTGAHALWAWSRNATLEAGGTARRPETKQFQNYTSPFTLGYFGWRGDGYLQQSATLFDKRLHLTGGVRLDTADRSELHPVSPQLAAAFRVAKSTELQLGAARYTYPFGDQVTLFGCQPTGSFRRGDHFTAGIEQRLGEDTRIRAQWFDREISEQIVDHEVDICGYKSLGYKFLPGTHVIQKGYSRGAQVILQRRSANRLSGWIGYTYVSAQQASRLPTPLFAPAVFTSYYVSVTDQPHSLNLFGMYRLKPSINLSSKFLYGSGFPALTGPGLSQSVPRLPDYLRLDVRADKSWAFRQWKMSLYGEVLNLTNHDNRIANYVSYDPNTGQYLVNSQRALPITPTVGVAFEF